MATFRDRRIKGASESTNIHEEISGVKKGFHVPPLAGATVKEARKKKKDRNKEKKKSSNGINQSKDLGEKFQTEQWTNGEISDALTKGHAKAKERKSCKSKNAKHVSDVTPAPSEEDKPAVTDQEHESLRWEGVLEDPVAEARRLEVYKANRRKRYVASRQAFLQNIQTGLDSNSSKLNVRNKPGVLT